MIRSLLLVVPCKNETKRLQPEAFLDAVTRHPCLTLLFVDDGSTDATNEILVRLTQRSPSVHAIRLPRNVGKAEAVRAGVSWALANTDCDTVGFWDADLATPFSELPAFLEAFERTPSCLAALGARWPHLGGQIDRSAFRQCSGAIMKALIRAILRIPVHDTQCGAKIFRRALAERLFATPFISRWLFDVELLRRMSPHARRCQVTEIPLARWQDIPGSKIRLRDVLLMLPDLVRIALSPSASAD